MSKFPLIEDVVNYLANGVPMLKKETDCQLIEGLGEIEINKKKYQIQIVLEPRASYYASEEREMTIRKTIESKTLSEEINNDLEQPQRAIYNYFEQEIENTVFKDDPIEFYQNIIDTATHLQEMYKEGSHID